MYGNGYSMAIVLDHRSTATSLTGNMKPIFGTNLVRIFHDEVFSLIQLHTSINDTAEYSPRVVHVEINLVCKLAWFELLGSEDDMLG